MGFLDDLTRKSQIAFDKASDQIEITKLKAAISKEENNKKDIYCNIGMLYEQKFAANTDDEFVTFFAQLNECNQKIADAKKQIAELKGLDKCPRCNAELEKGVGFCSQCGTKLTRVRTAEGEVVVEDVQ